MGQTHEDNLLEIVNTLGVLPDISVKTNDISIKVILCLEGPTDVEFFNHIGKLFDLDIEKDHRILSVSLGGNTLSEWVNKGYLSKLNKPEVHIYDGDVEKYQITVDSINGRKDSSWATLTKMHEIENYIHPSLINKIFLIEEEFVQEENGWLEEWKRRDVPNALSIFLKKLKTDGNTGIRGESCNSIKKKFSQKAAPLMTIDLLKKLKAHEEVKEWFDKIQDLIK